MITHIKGRLSEKSPTNVVIETNGIGYWVNISLTTFSQTETESYEGKSARIEVTDSQIIVAIPDQELETRKKNWNLPFSKSLPFPLSKL